MVLRQSARCARPLRYTYCAVPAEHSSLRRRLLHSTPRQSDAASKSIPPFYPALPRNADGHTQNATSSAQLPDVQVDHLVVGGGVVGLAVARQLAQAYPDKTTFLVERHRQVGQETSSRNSEVIHAGIFYAPTSLKTNLCLRGRELMYDFCQEFGVPFQQTGKLVVGTSESKGYFEGVLEHVNSLQRAQGNIGALIAGDRRVPPLELLSGEEARMLEPDLGPNVGWTLHSPRTGIVSSHDFMATLERHVLDSDNAEIVFDTSVVGLRPLTTSVAASGSNASKRGDASPQGWIVETQTEGGAIDSILARHVVNASGLNGTAALNSLAIANAFSSGEEQIGAWFSKGNYASYAKSKGGVDHVKRLIYPLPDMGASKDRHGHQGLGTHLTLDLDGNIRFGPDTDWLRPPDSSEQTEWWTQNLVALQPTPATMNQASEEERLAAMHTSVSSFLPGLSKAGLAPDYAGIRPKLVGPAGGFVDFTVLYHSARNLQIQPIFQQAFTNDKQQHMTSDARNALYFGDVEAFDPQPSLVTLCGVESPGLTSSLAIAEMAAQLIASRGWGEKSSAYARRARTPPGARNDDAGSLDDWA